MLKGNRQDINIKTVCLINIILSIFLLGCKTNGTPKPNYSEIVTARALTPKPTQTPIDTKTPGPSPTLAPSPTPFDATLYCPECAGLGIKINIWSKPNRQGIKVKVPHNTIVSVIDKKTYNGLLYYKIRIHNIVGWVSEDFIKK